jgi:ADP-heptose:LPS heptosyltransferase
MPTDYWQAIIDGLAKNHKVALIGKDDQNRGTVDVKCPDNVIDLRNLLDLGSLIAIISEANVLISNDSAPIHIAGAFDNWIVLLPTCKHPDYVLPYRNGNPYYKALALYKALPSEEYNSQPTTVHGSTAELLKGKWEDYLLSPDEIIERIGALCPVQ